MTYLPDIPQPGEKPSISQGKLLDNFKTLNSVFGENHYEFNSSTNAGRHKFVQYIAQSAAPSTVNMSATYVKNVTGIGACLFWKQGGGGEVRLTGFDPVNSATGHTPLAGALILEWGISGTISSNSDEVQSFSKSMSANAYSIVISGIHNGGSVVSGNVHTLTTSGFTIRNTSADARQFYWMAIGPRA